MHVHLGTLAIGSRVLAGLVAVVSRLLIRTDAMARWGQHRGGGLGARGSVGSMLPDIGRSQGIRNSVSGSRRDAHTAGTVAASPAEAVSAVTSAPRYSGSGVG